MTKEQKDLLKRVICAMLPYGVKATTTSNGWNGIYTVTGYKDDRIYLDCPMYDEGDDEWLVESVKPYLRPMSSMTGEERREYNSFIGGQQPYDSDYSAYPKEHKYIYERDVVYLVNWLNSNHFDYRGLLPLGLAIEVTKENNPYKD